MGKISDALEKSHKKKDGQVSASKDLKKALKTTKRAAATTPPQNLSHLDQNLVTILQPHSFEAEQFKILRSNILFPTSGKPPRMIMVTSAVPGEGKSFVASNLSVSIAQNIDEHVLLIDCDLRLPTIHKRFAVSAEKGLSEYLTSDIPLESLFVKANVEKLSILPAGRPPHNPAELLSSDKMAHLLEEVKQRYEDRFIIVDSAPPQLTAESGALAQLVDGILIVINYGQTKREIIADLIEMLGKEKLIGVVLNRFNLRSSSYYGYGKYSKYLKYYDRQI